VPPTPEGIPCIMLHFSVLEEPQLTDRYFQASALITL
jgi:hypothetical protein